MVGGSDRRDGSGVCDALPPTDGLGSADGEAAAGTDGRAALVPGPLLGVPDAVHAATSHAAARRKPLLRHGPETCLSATDASLSGNVRQRKRRKGRIST